ncbi:MAG: PAS domain-containing protein [Phycisphaerae bacterium]|nr:PAS domain-containing protein [Phycisphaerae bacterium]
MLRVAPFHSWLVALSAALALAVSLHAQTTSLTRPAETVEVEGHLPDKRILLLHSYTARVRYTRMQDTAIREGVARGYAGSVDFFTSELDFNIDEDVDTWSSVHEFLKLRYATRQLDLIIATDTPALRFLQRYGPETFPGVPIVFSASKEAPADQLKRQSHITGVVETVDVRGTIELMLRLDPGTRRLLIINNSSEHGTELRQKTLDALESMGSALEVEWLQNMGLDQVRERLLKASRDSSVLFLTYWDVSGKRTTLAGTLGAFTEACPRPIYVLFDAYMGYGTIGGRVASAQAYGDAAAKMAVRVLMGADASSIPMVASVNPTLLDARQLKRFNIPPESIPADATILFVEPTFFERNARILAIATLVSLFLSTVIVWLLVSSRRLQRATRELRASEERFRTLGENLPGLAYTIVVTPEGKRIPEYLGPGLEHLLGHDNAARLRKDIGLYQSMLHPDDRARAAEDREKSAHDGAHFDGEYRLIAPDGSWRWIRSTARPTRLPDGSIRWHGVILDISATKKAEEALRRSEERYRLASLAGKDVIWDWDILTHRIEWNEAMSHILGYPTDLRQTDFDWWIERVHEDDRAKCRRSLMGCIRSPDAHTWNRDYRFLHADGRYVEIADRGYIVRNAQGQAVRAVGVMVDVTERRQAEIALRESEERYRLVFQATNDVMWDWDIASNTVQWSESLRATFGAEGDHLVTSADDCFNRIHPDDVRRVANGLEQFVAGNTPAWHDEYRFRRTDGVYAWVADRASIVRDESGKPTRVIGAMTDVTALRDAERRLRLALEAGSMASWEWDLDAGLIHHSEGMGPMFNLPAGAGSTAQDDVIEQIIPEDRAVKLGAINAAFERPDGVLSVDYRVKRPNGHVCWLSCQGRAMPNDGRNRRHLFGVTLDITRLKNAEAALRESESRYRQVVEALPVGVLVHDGDRIYFANDSTRAIFRTESLDAILRSSFAQLVHPDHHPAMPERLRSLREERQHLEPFEVRLMALDGTVVHAEIQCSPAHFSGANLIQTTILDLTERRRAELALRESEEKFRQITENAAEVFWLTDVESERIRYLSPAFESVWGVPRTEFLKTAPSLFAAVHPDDRERVESIARNSSTGFDHEYRIVRPDGTIRWVRDRAYPVRDPSGRTVRIAGVAQDITDAKAAQEILHRTSLTQQLLLSELDHRVKNSLSGLLTLIDLTRAATNDVQVFAESIRARVLAMASVHTLLSEGQWAPVELSRMIRSLLPSEAVGRIDANGPAINIPARQVTALAMILQELFTNSMKHGAAGAASGVATIRWSITDHSELVLQWNESHHRPIASPVLPGVGTRLIQGFCKFELNGHCQFNYSVDGVAHQFRFRLDDAPFPQADLKPLNLGAFTAETVANTSR